MVLASLPGLAALFLVILVLAAINVWLGRKADNQLKGGNRKIKRYLPFAIIISTVALLVTLVVGVYLNNHTNFVNQAKDELLGVSMPNLLARRGQSRGYHRARSAPKG